MSKTADLDEYRRKRDPTRTNEPFGTERITTEQETRQGHFVVHLHDASRLHYDVRLQVGPVLASFAVPKGPSMNPDDSRLAVRTEDHDLLYLDFEEVIPPGNYGAGPMIVWDFGRVRYLERTAQQGLDQGKLDLELQGFKLRGGFVLIDTSRHGGAAGATGPQWLLRKKNDAFASARNVLQEEPRSVISGLTIDELARRRDLEHDLQDLASSLGAPAREVDTRHLVPMLCASSGATLGDAERIYELKLDGVRVVADRRGEQVTLRYRNGRSATLSYPETVRAMRSLPVSRVVLDGEILAFDEAGRPSFQKLSARIHAVCGASAWWTVVSPMVVFIAFDVLQLGALDLRQLPLRERKRVLAGLLRGKGLIRALDHLEGDGGPLYDFCLAHKLEGVVAKRLAAPYRPGPRRTTDWVKIKCERDDDFVVLGWTEGKGGRQSLGALLLGSWTVDGALVYRGKVGSGLDDVTIAQLRETLMHHLCEAPPQGVELPADLGTVHFTEPRVVVSVRHLGWSDSGKLRHPVLRGRRGDVEVSCCTAAPREEQTERLASPAPRSSPVTSASVALTHKEKVYWPDDGYTKGDLLAHYAGVAPVLLPYLRRRPVVLVRYPDGIEGESFHQWRLPRGAPPWIRGVELQPDGDTKSALVIDDVDGLLYVANLGCIEIHMLASRERTLDACDFLVLDFDIGEQPLRHAVTLALKLREILDDLVLTGFPKTSGQTGLHVLVPLGGSLPFDTARMLAELLGRLLVSAHEAIATMERSLARRGPRVFVDTGQVGRTRTIVAPYSVRARPGAPVSTPLDWEELTTALDPSRYTIATVLDRIESKGDPMEGMLGHQADIAAALTRLERWVKGRP